MTRAALVATAMWLFGCESGGSNGPVSAESVSYDPTGSGLAAKAVQEAIDALDVALDKATAAQSGHTERLDALGAWCRTASRAGSAARGRLRLGRTCK